jgi:hypothetical protein
LLTAHRLRRRKERRVGAGRRMSPPGPNTDAPPLRPNDVCSTGRR